MRHHKVKPLAGQLSLLCDLPVMYCPICGRRLTCERSQKAEIGTTCRRRAAHRVVMREITKSRAVDGVVDRIVRKVKERI
jgi:hypothetical protein